MTRNLTLYIKDILQNMQGVSPSRQVLIAECWGVDFLFIICSNGNSCLKKPVISFPLR